tara:strand:- start:22 stop:240 length:219 start_codon:yes stop_codon:yes gene_type:complete
MITNNASNLYSQAELALRLMDKNSANKKVSSAGLLSPMRSNKPKETNKDNPAYRAIEYFNTLRNKRMERKDG